MANVPVQGYDCSVTVTGETGPVLVGKYQKVDLELDHDTEEYLPLGERIAQQLDGIYKPSGKLSRGWLDTGLIADLFGSSKIKLGETVPDAPRFTVEFSAKNAGKGVDRKHKLYGVVFGKLTLSAEAGKGVVKEDQEFKAEGYEEI